MRLSRTFMPLLREDPVDAQSASHRLMLRAGLIRQEAAGIYTWLPLGLRVLRRVERIVREEMERAGAVELLMPTLQLADLWRESGRYDDYGEEMLRIRDRNQRDLLYGPTAEEQVTAIFRAHVRSYRDLPLNLYNIQWKFRDERRPRSGVLRGREFLMKDAYSFDLDEAGAQRAYHRMFLAYLNIFARIGITALPVRADPGPIGGGLSHEFVMLAPAGESEVRFDTALLSLPPPGNVDWDGDLQPEVEARTRLYAAADEMHDPARFAALPPERQGAARGIEVAHIFYFGEKYARPMKAVVAGPDGEERTIHGGSYGVGISRVIGAMIEASHDAAGIIWPAAVAPFDAAILDLKPQDAASAARAEAAYGALRAVGLDPLLDDTDARPGAKFARADLMGLPWQVVVSSRLPEGQVELKHRATGARSDLPLPEAITRIQGS